MKRKINIANDIAKGCLKGTAVVEVTSTSVYLLTAGDLGQFDSPKQLTNEWFKKWPLSRYHASRDGTKVNNSETVTKIRIIHGTK